MCGDAILLADGADGHVAALVRAADIVVRHATAPVAVIGGLAVACRLASTHRVTRDVDIVSDESAHLTTAGTLASRLVEAGIATTGTDDPPTRIAITGAKVEIIETTTVDAAAIAAVEPEIARLFVASHRWAVESATECTVQVAGAHLARVPVATAPALVAMKLHAIQDRADDRKRASDAWDIYRLLETRNADGTIARELRDAPAGLAALVASAIENVFVGGTTQVRRWVRTYGDPRWAAEMTDARVVALGRDLIDEISGG